VTVDDQFEYVRHVDAVHRDATPLEARYAQSLLDADSGAQHCTVSYIRTAVGGGSPAGMHVHEVDQIFYILSGTMSIEIQGVPSIAEAGSLIVFPAGVPHRNWNDGDEPTVHIAFNVPMPDPAKTFAISVADSTR
jgi:mannose-6-phosphate isomerase-like protein (cupin superfamily)